MSRARKYCELKMYQWKASRWLLLMVDEKNELGGGDFKFFRKEWAFDPKMEVELNGYRAARLEQQRATGVKLGRNDPCPCNSGTKFKKCCGDRTRN